MKSGTYNSTFLREEPRTPNTSRQEEDILNINVEDHDKLDFEPEGDETEEVDEKILDDTKVTFINTCYDLRNNFRTRRRPTNPSKEAVIESIPGIKESKWIIRYFYIIIQLFMQQLFYTYLYYVRKSYLGANLYCMLSRVFMVCE